MISDENVHFSFMIAVIIQRNTKGYGSHFNKDWIDYKRGFGNVNGKYFWIGLDEIHKLTKSGSYSLEVVLKKNGATKTIKWSSFKIGNEIEKYKLSISGFDAGSSGLPDRFAYHNEMYFTTRDKDNDKYSKNCAQTSPGGWWFNYCMQSNLNRNHVQGPYYSGYWDESTMILQRY